jgi:predicted glycoside hydrolase/deacetylase ChbG (UPF0249 family)
MMRTNLQVEQTTEAPGVGLLMVNADDWGQDMPTTDRIRECCAVGTVSSVSAMVFMEDSERAADVTKEDGIEAGLHLNFTAMFTASAASARLAEHQERVARHLLRHRMARVVFHPGLMASFEYVAKTQIEEFCRLYGAVPEKIDGHHHMHLCANVLLQRLIPRGTMIRRTFSLDRGGKSVANHTYRKLVNRGLGRGLANQAYRTLVDRHIARHHCLTDYFFALPPLEPAERLQRIFALAGQFTVELETHPVIPEEYRYLTGGEFSRQIGAMRVARPSAIMRRYANPSLDPPRVRNHPV